MPKKNIKEEKKKEVKSVKNVKVNKESDKNNKENKKSDKKTVHKNPNVSKFFEWFDQYRLAIYGVIGGVLTTVLVVILIWPDRIATLKDGTQPVAKIDGLTVTADDLYTDMKEVYSISSLLEKIDNKILEKKYPETDEMNDELKSEAENYYNVYEQYYGTSKEDFLKNNGFGSEAAFLEYLRLDYRRNKYTEDYAKSLITDNEIDKYYKDSVFGDINTKHILVRVEESATDEEKEKAKKLAEEIISKLNDGKTFDEVKEEYKDSTTYEELGYKSYNASLESAYMEEMQKLSDNSYSKTPVETSYGYHIIYRIDQKEKPSLEDVKEDVIQILADKKIADDTNMSYISLDKMRKDAGLKFTDTVLEKKYDTYMDQHK